MKIFDVVEDRAFLRQNFRCGQYSLLHKPVQQKLPPPTIARGHLSCRRGARFLSSRAIMIAFLFTGLSISVLPPAASAQSARTLNFQWDGAGNLSDISDQTGITSHANYDALRRMTDLTLGQGSSGEQYYSYSYDTAGYLDKISQAKDGAHQAWVSYDVFYTTGGNKRLAGISDPDGDTTSYAYDVRDWLEATTDPENRVTMYEYEPTGEQNCVKLGVGTSLQQTYQRTDISVWGEPSSYTPAKGNDNGCGPTNTSYTTQVGFDAFGRSVRTSYPDQSYTLLELNGSGNPLFLTTRDGVRHEYVYDSPQGQLSERIRKSASGGQDVFEFAYNAAGTQVLARITRSDTSVDELSFEYNEFGQLAAERRSSGLDTEYLYDRAGRRTAIIWPDNWTARYVYDDAGRLKEVWADPDGSAPCASAVDKCGDGIVGSGDEKLLASYGYDGLGRLERIDYDGNVSTSSSHVSFGYEDDGDLKTESHVFGSESVEFTYTYDGSGKLKSAAADSSGWLWSPLSVQTDTYDEANVLDQYPAVNEASVDYDANGNMSLAPDGATYEHNSDNQLISALVDGTAISYRYDARGRRISREIESITTGYVHAGDMEIAEVDVYGVILMRYVPGLGVDQRVAMVSPTGQVFYFHSDRLGNVIAMASKEGAVSDQYVYTPFGILDPLATSGNPFRYTGRRFDAETGLYYYRARYYNPKIGRF